MTPAGADNVDTTSSTSFVSLAKRLAAVEMRELTERQRGDHAQRMYDEQRQVLRRLEDRNLEVEASMAQLNRNYMQLLKSEQALRDELSACVPRTDSEADRARINELERIEQALRLEVSRLRELTEITLYQTASLEFIHQVSKNYSHSDNASVFEKPVLCVCIPFSLVFQQAVCK